MPRGDHSKYNLRGIVSNWTKAQIVECYVCNPCITLERIAKKFNVSQPYVSNILTKYLKKPTQDLIIVSQIDSERAIKDQKFWDKKIDGFVLNKV